MELLVITRPDFIGETSTCNELFAKGLRRLHLRKPEALRQQMANWIEGIEACYRSRIVVHDHFDLALQYGLGGIHLGRRNPDVPDWLDPGQFSISRSCHSLDEVKACQEDFDYLFLSPIFDSISKQGYHSAFTIEDIAKAHQKGIIDYRVMALGGITFDKIQLVQQMGFGGAMILGDAWK